MCFQGPFPCTQNRLILVTWHHHTVRRLIISSGNIILSDSGDDAASNDSDKSGLTDIEPESDGDLDKARTTENYKNMKVLGDKDREVTAFYLLNEILLNLVYRWPLKSRRLSGLLTFVLSLNVMTIASTQTRGRSKVCGSRFEPII